MYYDVEYYYTDLFHAINDASNAGARGHPVFSALLYAFCPMAAKWWLNGAAPVAPYDVVWDAVSAFASGITLVEALEKREVPDLLGHVKKYISVVETYRTNQKHNYRSSELSPMFTGEEIEVTARTGYQAAFDKHFGGDWRNVLRFARAWAFTIPDWRGDAKIQPGKSEYEFKSVNVALSVPRLNRRTLEWPAWNWRVKNGYALQIVLGMMVNDNLQDQLRFALVTRSNGYYVDVVEDGKNKRKIVPWEVTPAIYSFDRQAGWAKPLNAFFDIEKLVESIPSIAAIAEKGACLPLNVLSHYKKCEHCGFQTLCFTKNWDVTSIVYGSMREDAEKFNRTIS
jgi:hypothetical protein